MLTYRNIRSAVIRETDIVRHVLSPLEHSPEWPPTLPRRCPLQDCLDGAGGKFANETERRASSVAMRSRVSAVSTKITIIT